MKKLLVISVILSLVLMGCVDEDENNKNDQIKTSLKIFNHTSYYLINVSYASSFYGDIDIGGNSENNVSPNSPNPIYFALNISNNLINCKTNEIITILEGSNENRVIQNTIPIEIVSSNERGTLKDIYDKYNVATTLTIINTSDYDLYNIEFYGVTFGNINSQRSSLLKDISAGTRDIFFYLMIGGEQIRCRTDGVTTEKDIANQFTFSNNTPITVIDDGITDTLKNIIDTMTIELNKPQIVIKQGSLVIEQHGDFSFGTALINAADERTFTIQNTGKTNLTFETVNSNRINMTDNTSGYFSVLLQPLSPTVTPGSSVTFNIRFSPKAKGNNFAASVEIKTNSRYNNEFIFRVVGNCSNEYKIGDTGPGSGIVFFAQGGQYKEISGELGNYTWSNAVTTAKNYKGGGFSNWSLPDRGELSLALNNLGRQNLGSFDLNYFYWTSEETSSDAYVGYLQTRSNPAVTTYTTKNSLCRTRAVRSFTLN